MSVKRGRFLAILFTVVLAAALFYFYNLNTPRLNAEIRKPFPEQSVFTSKGVNTRVLKVLIEFEKVNTDSETAELSAYVSMAFDFNSNLNFKWKLGEGVNIVEGDQTGLISSLKAGEEKIIRIKVTGFSLQQNRHVGFEVAGTANGRSLYGDALVASDLENTFENTVQNVERLKATQ